MTPKGDAGRSTDLFRTLFRSGFLFFAIAALAIILLLWGIGIIGR